MIAESPHAVVEAKTVSLRTLRKGETATVVSTSADASDDSYLRALGIGPDARIRLCRGGEPCIITVSGRCGGTCRVALASSLASSVHVQPDA